MSAEMPAPNSASKPPVRPSSFLWIAAGVALVLAAFVAMWLGASLGALLEPMCSDAPRQVRPGRCLGPVYYTIASYLLFGGAGATFVAWSVKRNRWRRSDGRS